MNYLAHALLAGDDPAAQTGALLGDFMAGVDLSRLPASVRAAVVHHRRVDAFTDRHPVVRTSRQRLDPRFRHLRAVMVDLFYDHFLANHWERYGRDSLQEFTSRVYAALWRHERILSPRLRTVLPHMSRYDWLASYRDLDNVQRALDGMARRMRRPTNLGEGLSELRRRYADLERDFHGFFPQVAEHCPPPA